MNTDFQTTEIFEPGDRVEPVKIEQEDRNYMIEGL